MRTFSRTGERVFVVRTEDDILVNLHGEVTRICSDGRAWIQLDEAPGRPHSGAKVRTYPEDCEIPRETARDRRRAEREAARPQVVTPDMFGRDHETTLLYIETCCVDHAGIVKKEHLRCDGARHPLRQSRYARDLPKHTASTRLADGSLLSEHDDWDCIDDMIACGWLLDTGGLTDPQFVLTDAGWAQAQRLRRERAARMHPGASDATHATAGAESRA